MSAVGADRKTLQEVFHALKDKEELVSSLERFLGVKDRTLLREWLVRDSTETTNTWTLQISSRSAVADEEPKAKPKKRKVAEPVASAEVAKSPEQVDAFKE